MDERSFRQIVREELKKLSGMPWGQRLGYIWDYYKPLMVAVLVIMMLISIGVTVYHNLQINYLFQAYLINCDAYATDAEEISAEFAAYIGGIGELDEITVDATMSYDPDDTSQYGIAEVMKLTALGAAGDIDVMTGDGILYEHFLEVGGLQNLEDVLSEEELEAWSDNLVTGTDPESGEEGVYAIRVTDSPVLSRYPAYPSGESYVMIHAGSSRPELSVQFFHYLMGD